MITSFLQSICCTVQSCNATLLGTLEGHFVVTLQLADSFLLCLWANSLRGPPFKVPLIWWVDFGVFALKSCFSAQLKYESCYSLSLFFFFRYRLMALCCFRTYTFQSCPLLYIRSTRKILGKQCDDGRVGDGILHQLSLSLGLCHLCETMRTKRVLRALGTLL